MKPTNTEIRRQMSFGVGEPRNMADMQITVRHIAPEDQLQDGVYYAMPGETACGIPNLTHRRLAITVVDGKVVNITPAD